ncbi:MAG: hypothetical protein KID00_14590 [Clostridium argentinense]|nr:hypothetical protein [Clostridium argentinense]
MNNNLNLFEELESALNFDNANSVIDMEATESTLFDVISSRCPPSKY